MTIDYRHGVSILELIIYVPVSLVAFWMAFHHGFKKSSGWIFYVVFSLARVVGAICYLATFSGPKNGNLYIAWAVCTSLGLSPLLQASVGLLSRANDSIMRKTARPLPPTIFKLVGVFSLIAFILVIVGQTQNTGITRGVVTTETQVALILFLAVWVALCVIFLLIANRFQSIENGEHRLLIAVGISIPLLLVRLVYSLVYAFGHKAQFNILTGNVTIQLVMSVLEEIVIVFLCLGIGLTLQVRPSAEYNHVGQPSMPDRWDTVELGNNGLPGRRPLEERPQRGKYRGGPISWLVRFIVSLVRSRQR